MRWPWKQKKSLTIAQRAVEDILTRLADLPVGQAVVLPHVGDILVKRHSQHTLVFQRPQEHSRWANGPDEAREEIAAYITSGKLREPKAGEL